MHRVIMLWEDVATLEGFLYIGAFVQPLSLQQEMSSDPLVLDKCVEVLTLRIITCEK